MKKVFTIALLVTFAALSGCKTMKQAPITNLSSITRVKISDDLQTVISKLGIDPYDFKASTKTGYTLYTWKYKSLERETWTKRLDDEGEEKSGKKKYNSKIKELIGLFDSDYKLIGLYSEGGAKYSEGYSIEQNLLEKLQSGKNCQTCLDMQEIKVVTGTKEDDKEGNVKLDIELKLDASGNKSGNSKEVFNLSKAFKKGHK